MALPPERIAVKRRRDEEPVDALYIPYKKTKQTLVWNRVSQHGSKHVHRQPPPSSTTHDTHRVPTVQTTSPEGHLVASQANHSSAVQPIASKQTNRPIPSQPQEQGNRAGCSSDPPRPSLPCLPKEPRRFHFTPATATTKPSSPSIPASSVRHGGIRKSRKKEKKHFALFVERTCGLGNLNSRAHHGSAMLERGNGASIAPTTSSDQPSSSRKRPLASPAERKWRAQTWTQPSHTNAHPASATATSQVKAVATDHDSDPSLGLARELQQFALEETHRADNSRCLTTRLAPKVVPKPPKPRMAKQETNTPSHSDQLHQDAMIFGEDEEDADSFVIDVYVRQTEHPIAEDPVAMSSTPLDTADPGKVGLLVIEDEDQETWELYGEEDQSSDDGWSSDDEDENAEDYYGNDYPEDELDSDDEYGRNTYRHWQGAFDEEHFDGKIDWSDDESQAKDMWSSG
ncbi:MAG: hypothetical protein Q9168_001169 [Polycauliona sp. 1 TL-2023]